VALRLAGLPVFDDLNDRSVTRRAFKRALVVIRLVGLDSRKPRGYAAYGALRVFDSEPIDEVGYLHRESRPCCYRRERDSSQSPTPRPGPLPVMPLYGMFNTAGPVSKDTKLAYSVTCSSAELTRERGCNSRISEALEHRCSLHCRRNCSVRGRQTRREPYCVRQRVFFALPTCADKGRCRQEGL
jgi:hypothetical protein